WTGQSTRAGRSAQRPPARSIADFRLQIAELRSKCGAGFTSAICNLKSLLIRSAVRIDRPSAMGYKPRSEHGTPRRGAVPVRPERQDAAHIRHWHMDEETRGVNKSIATLAA